MIYFRLKRSDNLFNFFCRSSGPLRQFSDFSSDDCKPPAVFSSLGDLVARHMKRNGSGEFQIPDTGVKIRRVKKPARKSRMGRNPATGEMIKIAAKPAQTAVKVTALKALKDTIK